MSVIKRLIQFCPLWNFSHFRINWIQLFVQKADKNSVFIIFVFKFNSMLLSCYKFIHWVYEIKNTGNIVWYIWSFCSNLSLPTKQHWIEIHTTKCRYIMAFSWSTILIHNILLFGAWSSSYSTFSSSMHAGWVCVACPQSSKFLRICWSNSSSVSKSVCNLYHF